MPWKNLAVLVNFWFFVSCSLWPVTFVTNHLHSKNSLAIHYKLKHVSQSSRRTHLLLLSSWSNLCMASPLLSITSNITTTLYRDMIWKKQSTHVVKILHRTTLCYYDWCFRITLILRITLVRKWTTVLSVTFFHPRFLALKAAIFIITSDDSQRLRGGILKTRFLSFTARKWGTDANKRRNWGWWNVRNREVHEGVGKKTHQGKKSVVGLTESKNVSCRPTLLKHSCYIWLRPVNTANSTKENLISYLHEEKKESYCKYFILFAS